MVCSDIIWELFTKFSGHKEAPGKFVPVDSSKDGTTPENRSSDALEEMVPWMHPVLKQRYYYCFCGLPGKPDVIKKAHSSNFNRCFVTCGKKLRGCRLLRQSSSSMTAGTLNFLNCLYNVLATVSEKFSESEISVIRCKSDFFVCVC